ncbi:MAG: hypothetical protein IPK79_01305 [Vampirovibrionales bacterium]|nr:hypothetical protein [Vampirovibrionales bacterium]
MTRAEIIARPTKGARAVKHPMQPIEIDKHGVARFRRNKIVDHLFSTGQLDLNELARMDFPAEDQMQIRAAWLFGERLLRP